MRRNDVGENEQPNVNAETLSECKDLPQYEGETLGEYALRVASSYPADAKEASVDQQAKTNGNNAGQQSGEISPHQSRKVSRQPSPVIEYLVVAEQAGLNDEKALNAASAAAFITRVAERSSQKLNRDAANDVVSRLPKEYILRPQSTTITSFFSRSAMDTHSGFYTPTTPQYQQPPKGFSIPDFSTNNYDYEPWNPPLGK